MKIIHKRHDKPDEAYAPSSDGILELIKKWSHILDDVDMDDLPVKKDTVDENNTYQI